MLVWRKGCAHVPGDDLTRASAMPLRDFADAVQVAACVKIGAYALVRRNGQDFRAAKLVVRAAGEILARLAVAGR